MQSSEANRIDPEDLNLFMMCEEPDPSAFSRLPAGYHVRTCREDEVEIWKAFPFDDPADAETYSGMMEGYLRDVYAPKGKQFFDACLFMCNDQDYPIATGFLWRTMDAFTTLHWLKVRKSEEGKGLGRALLTRMIEGLPSDQFPIYLHTQPGSYRAIKLYADFGFRLLTNTKIGSRMNHLGSARPYLKRMMGSELYGRLRERAAPDSFLHLVTDDPACRF